MSEHRVQSITSTQFIKADACNVLFLAVMLSQRVGSSGIMATLSLITSWSQCSLKFGKLILLKDYLPYAFEGLVKQLGDSEAPLPSHTVKQT